MSITIANLANMEKAQRIHAGRRTVVAYSPQTGEEYSADPADYYGTLHTDKWVMRDENNDAMHLVVRITTTYDACSDFFDHPED